jgi:hypothetical protein
MNVLIHHGSRQRLMINGGNDTAFPAPGERKYSFFNIKITHIKTFKVSKNLIGLQT